MNIALIHRFFWKDGAIPLTVRNVAKNISQQRGIKVFVFASDVNEADSNDKVQFVRVFRKKISLFDISGIIFAISLFFKLITIHKKEKIDLLQIHDSTAFYSAWLFSKLYKIPNVMFMHACIFEKGKEGMYPKTQEFMYKLNTRFYIKHATLIACISERLTHWAERLGAKREKIKLINEPVDTGLFKPVIKNISKKSRTILFIGRFSPEKGAKYLVQAMPKIIKVFPQAKLKMIGQGNEKKELINLTKNLNIKNSIEFKGEIPNNQLRQFYTQADVLVIPSLSEGLPKVLLEALASGLPVIGTKVGGIPEVVKDGYNGLLIESKSSDEIAKSIIKLFSNENLLKVLSKNAYESAQIFSWEYGISKFLDMYNSLIKLKNE